MTISETYFRLLDRLGPTSHVRRLHDEPSTGDFIALRHDVDHDVDVALEMAYWEHRHGARATYYLLNSAPYWNDPLLEDKCRQLVELGHEVGLHVNSLANWFAGRVSGVQADLEESLSRLRGAGVSVTGVSAHGDPLCYSGQFANYWVFRELRPEFPERSERGVTAEGTAAVDARFSIEYPEEGFISRTDGERFDLWSVSMQSHGLLYDAMHVHVDQYFTDSGGGWIRSGDPMDADLTRGRVQVLVHPISWRDLPRTYFFLSTARSGSTWLSHVLDSATPFKARHEFTLNHRIAPGAEPVPDKRTSDDLDTLESRPDEVTELLGEVRDWVEDKRQDYAECNVYLERFLPQLRQVFPDATLVHLHRDPEAVTRSLLARGWYETADAERHPRIAVEGWDAMGQFERVCHYVKDTRERLAQQCDVEVSLEELTAGPRECADALERLGIPAFPRLVERHIGERLNATPDDLLRQRVEWTGDDTRLFESVFGEVPRSAARDEIVHGARAGSGFAPPPSHYGPGRERLSLDLEGGGPLLRGRGLRAGLRATLRQLRSVALSRGRGWREFIAVRWRRVGAGAGDSASSIIVCTKGCRLDERDDGLFLHVPAAKSGSYVVFGGGAWNEAFPGAGWKARVGCLYEGEISVEWETGEPVTLTCLSYDESGRQMHRRVLGRVQDRRESRQFAFRTPTGASRFCLALHAQSSSGSRVLRIRRLVLRERVPAVAEPVPGPEKPGDSSPPEPRGARVAGPRRLVKAYDQYLRYRMFLHRLIQDSVLRYPVSSAMNYAFTTAGIGLVAAGFVVVVRYFQAIGRGEAATLPSVPVSLDGSESSLVVVACVSVGLFGIGAVLQYMGRRRSFLLMGRYERFCVSRVLRQASRSLLPMKLDDGSVLEHQDLRLMIVRAPRLLSRMMFLLSTLIRDVVILLIALFGLFYIDTILAGIVFLTLLFAAPSFYRASLFAVVQTRRFERNAKPAQLTLNEFMRDLRFRPTPYPSSAPSIDKALNSGALDELIDAFAGRRLAMERSTLVATLVGGVLFFEIVLIMGNRLSGEAAVWADLLGFIVALQFFVLGLINAARGFTSLTRFYPQVVGYFHFVDAMARKHRRHVEARGQERASTRETSIPHIESDEGPLTVQAGGLVKLVCGVPFDRLLLTAVCRTLPGPGGGAGEVAPWWLQSAAPTSPFSMREFFGFSPEREWATTRQQLVGAGVPTSLPGESLDLDGGVSEQAVDLPADVQLALGLQAAREADADPVFIDGDLWGQCSGAMQAWALEGMGRCICFVVQEVDDFEPTAAWEGPVILCGVEGPVGWCLPGLLVRRPDLLDTIRSAGPEKAGAAVMEPEEEEFM